MSFVTLYSTDLRAPIAERTSSRMVPFYSKYTARVADQIVAKHFGVEKEWDKKLIKCMFLDSPELDCFIFDRKDQPEITYGATIAGDRNLLFQASPEEFYIPHQKAHKIQVKVSSVFGKSDSTLDYETIRTKHKTDYSVVALFNCETFRSFIEGSTNRGFVRLVEKVELSRL